MKIKNYNSLLAVYKNNSSIWIYKIEDKQLNELGSCQILNSSNDQLVKLSFIGKQCRSDKLLLCYFSKIVVFDYQNYQVQWSFNLYNLYNQFVILKNEEGVLDILCSYFQLNGAIKFRVVQCSEQGLKEVQGLGFSNLADNQIVIDWNINNDRQHSIKVKQNQIRVIYWIHCKQHSLYFQLD